MNRSTPHPKPTDWREWRRRRAWDLYQQGWKQREIAQALGATEGAVSQWISKAKAQGEEGLRHRPSPGAPPKLTAEQLAQLPALLAQGAEAFGFRGQVWTAKRVAQLIKREFGVTYHPSHCGVLLRRVGYSLQKPESKATQRNEASIEAWRTQRIVELKKRPQRKGEPCCT